MSHGKQAARDLCYGRRGGGWIDGDTTERATPVRDAPLCPVCDRPMTVGQIAGHGVCVGVDVAFTRPARKARG